MNGSAQRGNPTSAPAKPVWRVALRVAVRGSIALALHRLRFRRRVERFARYVESRVTTLLEEPTNPASSPKVRGGLPAAWPPTVSVIVNTMDRAELLQRLLRSLQASRYANFEVIVVVGPSSDHTKAVLEAWAGRIKLRDCPEQNLARSRNIGLAAASAEIAAFIDDDSVAEPDWLDRLVAPMRDAEVVGAGGPIRDRTGVAFQSYALETNRLAETRPTIAPTRRDSDWRLSLTGTNFCLRVAPALAVGGFDERYSYFLEETDIQRRLVDLGGRLVFTPDAEVHHAFAASARREADRAPTDFTTILASLVIFCRKFARGPQWRRAIAMRVAARLAEIEARLILLRARGLVDRRRALALLRSALRGVRSGAATRPAPMTSIAREEPDQGFLRFKSIQGQEPRGLRIALAGGADPLERDALEALASELAKLGHEATVVFTAGGAASAEFVDGYWRHFAVRRLGAAGKASSAAPGVGRAALAEMARVAQRRQFQGLVVAGNGARTAICYPVGVDGAPGLPPIATFDFGAAESAAARAAAVAAAMRRGLRARP